jgi:hypothetical protein
MKKANIFRLLVVLLLLMAFGWFVFSALNNRTDRDYPWKRTAIEEENFVAALNRYFNAYNSIPTGNANLIEHVLIGEDLNGKNPRKIQFLVLNTNRFDSNGNYLDPWQTHIVSHCLNKLTSLFVQQVRTESLTTPTTSFSTASQMIL